MLAAKTVRYAKGRMIGQNVWKTDGKWGSECIVLIRYWEPYWWILKTLITAISTANAEYKTSKGNEILFNYSFVLSRYESKRSINTTPKQGQYGSWTNPLEREVEAERQNNLQITQQRGPISLNKSAIMRPEWKNRLTLVFSTHQLWCNIIYIGTCTYERSKLTDTNARVTVLWYILFKMRWIRNDPGSETKVDPWSDWLTWSRSKFCTLW